MSGAAAAEDEADYVPSDGDEEGEDGEEDEPMDGEPEGTDDPPPSYGELHGRVLGTGMPPPPLAGGALELPEGAEGRGIRAVNRQDEEET